jgi:class 3 adenylate cyclase/tetratricopeptide (TPR) repeat protein
VNCASCGAENLAGGKFCTECGSPLLAVCPGCGVPAPTGAKFCGECGYRLAPAAPAAATPADTTSGISAGELPAGAERRLVTVLFVDLVGFTSLAEGRDAESVRDLLSRYFETASEIIRRYGGTVEKFIGDAVMAVWGAPRAHEDDAERAVRAALDLVASVHAMGDELGSELRARAGVLTGEAAVTLGATNQGLVAGDLVNTASRLQSVAPPGTVLVGEATRQAAGGSVTFEPAGETLLKGKLAPVAAYRAVRIVAKSRGVGRTDALEPPFVGRDAEFRLVREAFHSSARDRRARLVSITGEAGVGKSRLAWEFSKYTDGLADSMFWHEGRSPAYGEGITFWALGEMIRKRAGLLEADDDATTRERITATVARHVPDDTERPFVEACLLALLGLGEPPAGGRERLFAGWRLFFERLAAEDPVALVFEDIHWADDGLLDFVESLLQWSQSYPIFVITLSRPELLERRPGWGAGRNATSLPLGPLADEAMRDLLAGLVPGLPEVAARSILERAGGMPLYAVETVRMLVADGRLEPNGDGTFRAVGELRSIDVPASLQALISARLDGLDPADRSLLQDAAVLGQTFAVSALAAVVGEDEPGLEPRLRGLIVRDLLSLDTDPRSPERGQYGFVQALIREVAYSTLSRKDRRSRHLAAARYFEALGDEELAGALATHYLSAFEAAADGPEAQALASQARIALRSAGDRAQRLGAPEQAMTFYEHAARLPGDEAESLRLLESAGDVALSAGRYGRAESVLREAVEGRESLGDAAGAARVTAKLAESLHSTDRDEATRTVEAALARFAGLGDDSPELLELRLFFARAGVRTGHNREAAEILDRIMPGIERARDEEQILRALITRGAALSGIGQPIEGLVILEGAMLRAEAAGLSDQALRARINLSVLSADESMAYGRDVAVAGLEAALAVGSTSTAGFFSLNASEYDMHLGNIDAAIARTRRILELGIEAVDRAVNVATLATLLALRGEDDAAVTQEREQLEEALGLTDHDAHCWHHLLRGEFADAIRHGLALGRDDELNAPIAYFRVAIAAALAGDAATVAVACDELAGIGRWGRAVDAIRRSVDAIRLGLEGAREEGIAAARDADSMLRGQGLMFDAALAGVGFAAALRPLDAETLPMAQATRDLLVELRLPPLLALLAPILGESEANPGAQQAATTMPAAGVVGSG